MWYDDFLAWKEVREVGPRICKQISRQYRSGRKFFLHVQCRVDRNVSILQGYSSRFAEGKRYVFDRFPVQKGNKARGAYICSKQSRREIKITSHDVQ
jgi:hypothetical protein